jgi:hypothetical protein
MHTKILSENVMERGHLEDISVDGKIILEWISDKSDEKMWTGFN